MHTLVILIREKCINNKQMSSLPFNSCRIYLFFFSILLYILDGVSLCDFFFVSSANTVEFQHTTNNQYELTALGRLDEMYFAVVGRMKYLRQHLLFFPRHSLYNSNERYTFAECETIFTLLLLLFAQTCLSWTFHLHFV